MIRSRYEVAVHAAAEEQTFFATVSYLPDDGAGIPVRLFRSDVYGDEQAAADDALDFLASLYVEPAPVNAADAEADPWADPQTALDYAEWQARVALEQLAAAAMEQGDEPLALNAIAEAELLSEADAVAHLEPTVTATGQKEDELCHA